MEDDERGGVIGSPVAPIPARTQGESQMGKEHIFSVPEGPSPGAHGLGQASLMKEDFSRGHRCRESCGGSYLDKEGRGPGFRFAWKECEAGGTVGRRLARIPPGFWEV